MRTIQFTVLVLLLITVGLAFADSRYEAAEAHARSGNLEAIEAEYRKPLDTDPADTRARLGYATALSWRGISPGGLSIFGIYPVLFGFGFHF